ncbi:hypothetical protein HDU76_012190, partial [Blyttiomyces sp. JEL0837]
AEGGLGFLKYDYDLNYSISQGDLQEHERNLLEPFTCSATTESQQQHQTHGSTDLNNIKIAKDLFGDEFNDVLSQTSEAFVHSIYSVAILKLMPPCDQYTWIMREPLPLPSCCLPGSIESLYQFKPDMVCIAKPNIGRFEKGAYITGLMYAPLVCGEFERAKYGAHAVAPQAISSAIAAAITMLALDIPHTEISIPIFTASA